MSVGFNRRFLSDPGLQTLLEIEGVVIIDREPPALLTGAGSGTAHLVAEFENGPFNTPTELFSGNDLLLQFGGFGFTYDSVPSQYPCARGRKSDGAVSFEYWNGNGFLALTNKRFTRLIVTRVDTSVGSVSFTRCAALSGSKNFNFDLEPSQLLAVKLNGGAAVNATFTATAATTNSASGTYPSTFTGGESITYIIDDVSYTTYFLAADQTQAAIIARLNLTVGFTAFASVSATVMSITGRRRGTSGNVQIVSVSGALVTTATGFSAGAAVAGTGNVANIDQVTLAEVKTIVEAAVAGTLVDRDADGALRITNVGTPATGTIEFAATTTATGLGFTTVSVATAVTGLAGTIPAGTRVQTSGAVVFVTMQDVDVTAASAGPYSVKVRHANDDGTGLSSGVGTLTTMSGPISLGAFSVTNLLPITAALTEAQIDVAYGTALDSTKNTSSVAKQTDLIWAARSSNSVRSALRQNVLDASRDGCKGRSYAMRPPLGTSRAAARSSVSQPGVGTYRNQRVFFCYPAVQMRVPQIAFRGLAGGAGFTADGVIDIGSDGFLISVCSQLPPEEDPGQQTDFMTGALGIEKNNADVQTLTLNDYISFKANGICAPRFDGADSFFQSAVTSVDPLVSPNLRTIKRRRFADFIQDSLSARLGNYNKRLSTRDRRAQVLGDIDSFMTLLKGNGTTAQRLEAFVIDGRSGNTPDITALGLFWIKLEVRMLPSFEVIVLDVTVGETVTVSEAA